MDLFPPADSEDCEDEDDDEECKILSLRFKEAYEALCCLIIAENNVLDAWANSSEANKQAVISLIRSMKSTLAYLKFIADSLQ